MLALREVARQRNAQVLGPGDDERTGHVGPAQPFLARDRVVVERTGLDRDHTRRLCAVDEDREPGLGLDPDGIERVAGHPGDVRDRDQPRSVGDRFEDPVLGRGDDSRTRRVERPDQAEVLDIARHDLVVRSEIEPGEHDVAAVRRRPRQRDLGRLDAEQRRELGPHLVSHAERPREVRLSPTPLRNVDEFLGDHRLSGDARERAVRARVQVRVLLEDREGSADLLEAGHSLV